MFYPIHETFTMQTDTFQIIYPNYIDPTKTIQQGRRVPLHLLTGVTKVENQKTDDMIVEKNNINLTYKSIYLLYRVSIRNGTANVQMFDRQGWSCLGATSKRFGLVSRADVSVSNCATSRVESGLVSAVKANISVSRAEVSVLSRELTSGAHPCR